MKRLNYSAGYMENLLDALGKTQIPFTKQKESIELVLSTAGDYKKVLKALQDSKAPLTCQKEEGCLKVSIFDPRI